MRKVVGIALYLLIFIVAGCDSSEPSPSGNCRVAKIVYTGPRYKYEQNFEYNADGLLTGYNLPYIGSTCRQDLEYDDQQRLIKSTFQCGGVPQQTMEYKYLAPFVLEGKYKILRGDEYFMLLYYNPNYQLDSARWTLNNETTILRYQYDNGNLVSRSEIEQPCCRILTLLEARYDTRINPFWQIKKAANNFGMEHIDGASFPRPISVNNLLESDVMWGRHVSEDDPRILDEDIQHSEFSYEYYPNSDYPKLERHKTSNGEVSETIFFYEGCQ